MGSNTEEAIRAKTFAEKQFLEKNFVGAQKYALRAQTLCKELDGISQMVATFGVYVASDAMANGELDFYSILGVAPSVEKSKLKKQYKKMAVMLHPDKNKTVGADGAFRLVSEAWTLLSDSANRSAYDQRRSLFAGYSDPSKFSAHGRLDTFWTVCSSCHVQYEYLRKYVNKRLSCKNCRGVFVAVETGLAPQNGTFQYNYSYVSENGYGHGSHGRGVAYIPTATGYGAPNVVSGHHTGYRSEYASNISFQGSSAGNSVGLSDPSGLSSSSFIYYQANGEANQTKANGKHLLVNYTGHVGSNGCTGQYDASKPRRGRPAKKRKVELGISYPNGHDEVCANVHVEPKTATANGILKPAAKLPFAPETLTRRSSAPAPAIDGRQLLIDKARTEIGRKLEEMKLAAEAAAAEAEKRKALAEAAKSAAANKELEIKRTVSITVPDSDFHDFDLDRSEECFKPKQIWALYDEEDGMPRLYCIIREIISLKPFKIYISYLSSKSDTEFGSVNWLDCGFTKSCGSFRVFHSETVEQVNIFSHLLAREKAGRGGCVRIYPRSGDIWAVYRNWSPDWNRTTPDEVRHQYEMVEVLDDYSEDNGVCVAPLIKLDGYKTVYQRNIDKDATRWIPRREMLRFSHQVPSCSLKVESANLPKGCWDLDPAATPEELLQGETELHNKRSPGQTANISEIREEKYSSEEKLSQRTICASTPDKHGTQVPGVELDRITTELPQLECRAEEAPAGLPCVGTGARSC
ncbi:hypothetical protein AAHA92_11162 [Salvia divinorum]|uniref:J domain-containing protein n=1 Tax=Salvia divinorum TaxID=28513 RepID=A0ABD1HG37_SALDI